LRAAGILDPDGSGAEDGGADGAAEGAEEGEEGKEAEESEEGEVVEAGEVGEEVGQAEVAQAAAIAEPKTGAARSTGPLPQWCSPAAAAVRPAVRVEALDEEVEVPVGGAITRRRRAAAAGEVQLEWAGGANVSARAVRVELSFLAHGAPADTAPTPLVPALTAASHTLAAVAPGPGELVLTLCHVATGWFWESPIRTRVVLRLSQPAAPSASAHTPSDWAYEDLMAKATAKAVEAALHKALHAPTARPAPRSEPRVLPRGAAAVFANAAAEEEAAQRPALEVPAEAAPESPAGIAGSPRAAAAAAAAAAASSPPPQLPPQPPPPPLAELAAAAVAAAEEEVAAAEEEVAAATAEVVAAAAEGRPPPPPPPLLTRGSSGPVKAEVDSPQGQCDPRGLKYK